MVAVDLCSGDGWFTLPMAKIASRVIAIELDPAMAEVSRNRLAESGVDNCTVITDDAYHLSKHVSAADFVLIANAFHGVPDPQRMAEVVRNVLKPGGLFTIVNWHARPREETVILGEPRGPKTELRLSPEQTIAAVTAGSDLRLERVIEVPPYHYGAIFARPSAGPHAFDP
jgi:ubiquinone/menaquinone biosynthesis C-methylase UbiE